MAEMTDVKLNLINRSEDANNSTVAILPRNADVTMDEVAVAWKVIKDLGKDDSHPFSYPLDSTIGAEDSFGNFSNQIPVVPGDAFVMIRDNTGDVLKKSSSSATDPSGVELRNKLPEGSISALTYKDGSVFERKTNVAPGKKAVFSSKPVLYIGALSQIREGQFVNSAILQTVNAELNLFGIASADNVWTGGGAGMDASPFQFTFQNVVNA
ncbi:MAG: hypothetical protein NXH97_08880 [Rhodobacteraceae bacterium]|nr:hypothetical protein [Paracoccaceae bacterium]